MAIDRTKYFKGQAMVGAPYPGAFVIDGALRPPPVLERKPALDPRLAVVNAHTAALAATGAKLDRLKEQIAELAARVRRGRP